MSSSKFDSEYGKKVADLKNVALTWHSRTNWSYGISLVLGVVAWVGIWFIQQPIERHQIMFGGVLGLGLAVLLCGALLTRMLFPRPTTQCPQCGNDWSLTREYPFNLCTWIYCPGCGLQMRDNPGQEGR